MSGENRAENERFQDRFTSRRGGKKKSLPVNGTISCAIRPTIKPQRCKTIGPIYVKVETHLFRARDSDTTTQAAMQNYPICIAKWTAAVFLNEPHYFRAHTRRPQRIYGYTDRFISHYSITSESFRNFAETQSSMCSRHGIIMIIRCVSPGEFSRCRRMCCLKKGGWRKVGRHVWRRRLRGLSGRPPGRFSRPGTSVPFGVSTAYATRRTVTTLLNCSVPMQTWFCPANFDRYRLTPLTFTFPDYISAKTTSPHLVCIVNLDYAD